MQCYYSSDSQQRINRGYQKRLFVDGGDVSDWSVGNQSWYSQPVSAQSELNTQNQNVSTLTPFQQIARDKSSQTRSVSVTGNGLNFKQASVPVTETRSGVTEINKYLPDDNTQQILIEKFPFLWYTLEKKYVNTHYYNM